MNEQMYSYMHAILGPEIMSELDRLNENDEQKKAAVREGKSAWRLFCFTGQEGVYEEINEWCADEKD